MVSSATVPATAIHAASLPWLACSTGAAEPVCAALPELLEPLPFALPFAFTFTSALAPAAQVASRCSDSSTYCALRILPVREIQIEVALRLRASPEPRVRVSELEVQHRIAGQLERGGVVAQRVLQLAVGHLLLGDAV